MKNQVGREIPDEILARMGKTGYRGLHDRDNASYRKASPTVRALNDPQRGKLCASLREALEKCELHDGMYFGFHHHFRDGDYVINMVMQEVAGISPSAPPRWARRTTRWSRSLSRA